MDQPNDLNVKKTGQHTSQPTRGQAPPRPEATGGAPADPDPAFGLKFTLPGGEAKLFTALPVTIGRAIDNDIVLADETVSAQHAQIYYDPKVQDICIVDLDSLNGLFIGGQPTRKNVLNDGVKIGVGMSSLIFRNTGFIYPG